MNSLARMLTVYLAFVLLTAGCNSNDQPDNRVVSLKENIKVLEETARLWRQDSYLDFAHLAVLSGEFEPSPIRAHFVSPSTLQQSMLVTVEVDGTISTEIVEHTIPVTPAQPITLDDWHLDSPEALEVSLDADARRFLESNIGNQCSFMVLERDSPTSVETVVWRMTFTGCLLEPTFQTTIVDANSGEILRRKTY